MIPLTKLRATVSVMGLSPPEADAVVPLRVALAEVHAALSRYDKTLSAPGSLLADASFDAEQVWAQIRFGAAPECVPLVVEEDDAEAEEEVVVAPSKKKLTKKLKTTRLQEEDGDVEAVIRRAEKKGGKKAAPSKKDRFFVFGKTVEADPEEGEEGGGEEEIDDDDDRMAAHQEMYGTDDDEDVAEDQGMIDDIADIAAKYSKYEQGQAALKGVIADHEDALVTARHWTQQGEVSGRHRPKDSLLAETLETEYALKQVPVVTEETTATLEDRIRERIKNTSFDDVVKKERMTRPGDLVTSKRDDAADAEKSKVSLVDLYEKDYLERLRLANKDTTGTVATDLTQQEKDELKAIEMWRTLSGHLDALSNFHFTPKPVLEHSDDMRVRAVKGVAAVSIEERGTLPSAPLPQEVYTGKASRHLGIAKEELTPDERKRVRAGNKESAKRRKTNVVPPVVSK